MYQSLLKTKDFDKDTLKDNILNSIFEEHIIPISNNVKRIYRDDLNESNFENKLICNECDTNGIYYTNEDKEQNKIEQLEKDYEINNISTKRYISEYNKIYKNSHINKTDKGYNTVVYRDFDTIRYYDIKTRNWEIKRYNSSSCLLFEDKNSFKQECLIEKDDINIIGFLILNMNNKLSDYYSLKKIGDISDISVSKNAIITCNNHNLDSSKYIEIRNSKLPINGNYKSELNIIDNNRFTIKINSTNFDLNTDLGEIYSVKPIEFENVKNLNVIDDKNNLILFDKKLSFADYIEILNKIIPQDIDIFNYKIKNIQNQKELLSLSVYLDKFNYEEYLKSSKILNDELIKLSKIELNITENKEDTTNLYFFSDDIFFSKEIIELYGKYPYDKKNVFQKMKWINNSLDNGNFYFAYVKKHHIDNLKAEDVQKILNSYTKKIEELKVKIKMNNDKFIYEVSNLDEIKLPKMGDIAILSRNDDDNGNIYVFNKKWSFVKKDTSKTKKELCLFNIKNIEDIQLEDITTEYINEQCIDKSNELNREELLKLTNHYNSLLIYSNDMNIEKLINSEYVFNRDKLRLLNYKKIIKKNIIEHTKLKKLSSIYIVDKIFSVSNDFILKYLLYKLIDYDGITIGQDIYSKKYRTPICCLHWKYLKRLDNVTTVTEKNKISKELIDMFGRKSEGNIYCKNCNLMLNLGEYDEIEGFTSDGHLISTKTVIDEPTKTVDMNMDITDCSVNNIKSLMHKFKIPIESITIVTDVCNIIKLLTLKIGVKLKYKDYIKIILEAIKFIK